MTAISGAIFAAADFNQYVRDNLNETAVAKATVAGQFFAAVGANSLAARILTSTTIPTGETTTSTTYVDLATPGPAITVTTGPLALVGMSGNLSSNISNSASFMSVAVSGASTIAAISARALVRDGMNANNGFRATAAGVIPLTPGSNTFTAKYAVGAGSTGTFSDRHLWVLPF
jgi:hypothetical protein